MIELIQIKYYKERTNKKIMKTEHHTLTKTWVVAALASLCCILWGSAIPMIKTGYRLLQVDTTNTASQIVFAGIRFALAGLFVLIFASLQMYVPRRYKRKNTVQQSVQCRQELHILESFHQAVSLSFPV